MREENRIRIPVLLTGFGIGTKAINLPVAFGDTWPRNPERLWGHRYAKKTDSESPLTLGQ